MAGSESSCRVRTICQCCMLEPSTMDSKMNIKFPKIPFRSSVLPVAGVIVPSIMVNKIAIYITETQTWLEWPCIPPCQRVPVANCRGVIRYMPTWSDSLDTELIDQRVHQIRVASCKLHSTQDHSRIGGVRASRPDFRESSSFVRLFSGLRYAFPRPISLCPSSASTDRSSVNIKSLVHRQASVSAQILTYNSFTRAGTML